MFSKNNANIMNKGRIESFSDGVFSIILTLLVFNFKVPNVSGADLDKELSLKLVAMYPYCITYILSFILISIFWIAHHNLFHWIKRTNVTLLWLNNIFLLFLAFIPFPTQVLGAYPNSEFAAIFFGSAMVFASLAFSALRYYCYYPGKLYDDSFSDIKKKKSLTKELIGITSYVIAILTSFFSPDVTLSLYALIPFLFFIPINVNMKKSEIAD